MDNFDLRKYLTEGTLLQEGPADDLELKSIAKKLFPILKKYKMKVEYITDDVKFEATPKVDEHGVPAKLLIKDGVLTIGVYWLSLARFINELDMEPGGGPSDESRKNAKIQAGKMSKELKAELRKQGVGDEFEMNIDSEMNRWGWYIMKVRKKVVSEAGDVRDAAYDAKNTLKEDEVYDGEYFGGIDDLLTFIRDNNIDPSDALEAIGQEYGIDFEFGSGDSRGSQHTPS
jgi:hypothetical protein